ncbi:MAG: hypothetical protein RR993_01770 [Clostridia bacterium]
MIGLIVGGIICLCSTFCGICIEGYYKKRNAYMQDFLNFVEFALQNIKFAKDNTDKIFDDFLQQYYGLDTRKILTENCVKNKKIKPFAQTLIELKSEFGKSKTIGKQNLYDICQNKILNKKQIFVSIEIFGKFGVLDYANQLNHLEKSRSLLTKEVEMSNKFVNVNGKLAYKLGFLLGLALMILMI